LPDAEGSPMEGVTIAIKGGKTLTVTMPRPV